MKNNLDLTKIAKIKHQEAYWLVWNTYKNPLYNAILDWKNIEMKVYKLRKNAIKEFKKLKEFNKQYN